jgi:acetyltransferase
VLKVGIEKLNHMFNPKRIAVIGASDREGSIGGKILRNLIGVGFKGSVFPVNPFSDSVHGIAAYPSINKIPRTVDLAIIATPAHTVPQIVEECGKAGVSGVIICSAGFQEVGEEGIAIQKKILDLHRKYGIRIIGPNSFGVIRPKTNLYATFADERASAGKIAFISQSAALCASALDWGTEAHVGFSAVVSTGSMIDVDLGDLIDYFGVDAQTKSIVLYIESINNPRKFMSAARGFARSKPIIVVKAGRFQECVIPTLSHSGSMAGEDGVYDSAFKRAGVVRVETMIDLFNCAETLAMQPNPTGPNLTIITNAGGPGIMATDQLISKGGKIASLTQETTGALKSILPPYCCTANPIDIFEEATAERYKDVTSLSLKDPTSNGFLLIYAPQVATDPFSLAKIIVEQAKETKKPILTCLMGGDSRCRKARKFLQSHGIPTFLTPEQAVSTFMYMYRYTQGLELLYQTPEELSIEPTNSAVLKTTLKKAYREGQQVLNLVESLRFLDAYKIPSVKTLVAKTPKEAEVIADKIGYPVAMKVMCPQATHKTKISGVILNICSKSEIRSCFEELFENIKKLGNNAEFQGVAIQPMIRDKGYEFLIGSKKDSQFGSVILFGKGGTDTELVKDVSIGFPPLNQVLARRMIEDTLIFKQATSSELAFDIKPIEEVLVKLSQLVIDSPEISEIDINPLLVGQNKVLALDARIIVDLTRKYKGVPSHEHLAIAPYPLSYNCDWVGKNGAALKLRSIKPEDEGRFYELFKSLSPETMRFRFFEIIKELSHETLTRYCNLDYDREIAVVAENPENKCIVGVGRLIIDPYGKSGEYAVLVGDKWQGLGLGLKLMETLIQIAKDKNLEKIYGLVMTENYKMLNLCEGLGFKTENVEDEAVVLSLFLS